MVTRRTFILMTVVSLWLCTVAAIAGQSTQDHDEEPIAERRGVTLYQHTSFRGRAEIFYGDDANLGDNLIGHDQASSVKVPPGCTVALYKHGDYQGPVAFLYDDSTDLSATAVGNDAVSSLSVSCEHQAPPSGSSPPASGNNGMEKSTGRDVQPTFGTLVSAGREQILSEFQTALSDFKRQTEQALPRDDLKRYTVMITVTFDDQSVEHGAGVVLCAAKHRTYILTAHHVLAGKQPKGAKGLVRHAERTEIRFFHDSVASVVDEPATGESVITAHLMPEQDLALLSVPVVQDPEQPDLETLLTVLAFLGGSTGPEVRPSHWARAMQPHGPTVMAIGYRKSPMETWAAERGTLLAGNGELLRHSAEIVGGFSGGPLFHGSGALIGINLERIADENIGVALPMEQILPLIRDWMPNKCVRNVTKGMAGSWGALEAKALVEGMEGSWGAMETKAFFAEADRLKKVGPDWRFRFGPYRVTDVGGGEIKQGFRRTRATRTYSFSFNEANGAIWKGECSEKFQTEEQGSKLLNFALNQVFDTSLVVALNTSLECVFTKRREERMMELVLNERTLAEGIGGTGAVGAIQIKVAGAGSLPQFLFHSGHRILGAVLGDERSDVWQEAEATRIREYSVWLDPAVIGETRSACTVAAAAILLHFKDSGDVISGLVQLGGNL